VKNLPNLVTLAQDHNGSKLKGSFLVLENLVFAAAFEAKSQSEQINNSEKISFF
jgi:hypothetical protein